MGLWRWELLPMNAPVAHVDFESRSACSLCNCGAWRYSVDPSTEILCISYRLPYWEADRTGLWHPAFPALGMDESDSPDLFDLLGWILAGGLVEAHNAAFERCIWTNMLVPQYGWPMVDIGQWRCSAAKAAAHALPRSLEDAGAALGLTVLKDDEGHKLMMKLSKPRKSRKAERAVWDKAGVPHPAILYHESVEQFERLFQYCRQDILAEEALSNALADLSLAEQEIYVLDQTINARGFQLDTEAVSTALRLIASETKKLNAELAVVTDGKVKKATQRAQMMAWFNENGLELFDTQKETLDEVVKRDDLSAPARRGLEIVRTLGRSSTAKYQRMKDWMDPHDGRVRGGLLYHGATTGRWSGSGVQPHNFVRGSVEDMDGLWDDLRAATIPGPERYKECQAATDLMSALAQGLRGAIVAAGNNQLFVADYSSIEARVVVWLAGQEDAIEAFRTGADIYKDMASSIYGVSVDRVTKDQRALGKQITLGGGFGMGGAKFCATCEKYGIIITEEFAQSTVAAYREKFYRVKQLWSDQESAAISAVQSGRSVQCGYVRWFTEGQFLFCELPSGRRLSYPFPEVRQRETPWGAMKPSLTFKGVDAYTRKWKRQSTYGGSLVENIVQSCARDLMAAAMLRCEQSGYPLVLTVHDELVAEVPVGFGSVHAFEQLVIESPDWATDCPIAAEAWVGCRYKK